MTRQLRLKGSGALVFDKDFPPPSFREFNFVYGANGSGKTSLANSIEESVSSQDGSAVRFDREYASEALSTTNAVKGLWVVAPDAKSLVEERDALVTRISEATSKLELQKAELRAAESACKALVEPLAKELRDLKRAARRDASAYSPKQAEEALRRLAKTPNHAGEEDLQQLAETIRQEVLHELDPAPILRLKSVLTDLLNAANSVSPETALLASRVHWVQDGLPETGLTAGDPCPFCTQPLSEMAIREISHHGSAPDEVEPHYESLVQSLSILRGLDLHAWPDPDAFDRSLQLTAAATVQQCRESGHSLAESLPSATSVANSLATIENGRQPRWLQQAHTFLSHIDELLESIREHNHNVLALDKTRVTAFERYEAQRLAQTLPDYLALDSERVAKQLEHEQWEGEVDQLNADLADIAGRIRGLLNPQVLNSDLKRYLGHQAIRFESQSSEENEMGYRIVRADGRDAQSLSEGEITAIALLYFLRGLREDPNAPDYVVIDDPVTSLDDAGVFTAHSFIKDAVSRPHGEAGPTVIITTHNHGFFRLLADWAFHLNRDGRERANLLEAVTYLDHQEQTTCRIRPLPEAVANAGSEYSVLMARLVEYAEQTELQEAIELYVAPNLARRVIEGFLTFKFGGPRRASVGELLDWAFKDPRLDEFGTERRERVHKLLNTAAHGSSLADTYQTITSRSEVALVISDVLEMIQIVDPDHLERFRS